MFRKPAKHMADTVDRHSTVLQDFGVQVRSHYIQLLFDALVLFLADATKPGAAAVRVLGGSTPMENAWMALDVPQIND